MIAGDLGERVDVVLRHQPPAAHPELGASVFLQLRDRGRAQPLRSRNVKRHVDFLSSVQVAWGKRDDQRTASQWLPTPNVCGANCDRHTIRAGGGVTGATADRATD